ncbi:hypothetical protein HY639_05030 [Candidatus Woesearchaeota archaeon]|nr:hypothetical protein [Candidatus Woesearchaeota archaeon]
MEKQTQQAPERKFSTGAIQVTVWKNTGTSKDGKQHEYRTFGFARRYCDKTGAWKSTASLRVNDLPKAIVALNKAYEFAILRAQAEEEELVI